MRKNNIYISGPMRGIEDFNYPKFNRIANELTELGCNVFNPANNPVMDTPEQYMDVDLALLRAAEIVYLLKGWEHSKGATVEVAYAIYLEYAFILEDGATDPVVIFPYL